MTERCISHQWQTALRHLRLSIEYVQATADQLPADLDAPAGTPNPGELFDRHLARVDDFTVALACVQALIWRRHPP